MANDELLRMILRDEVLIPCLIAGGIVLVVAMKTIGNVIRGVSRERTRREIAAFIAEGSMTPEQGERLLKAGDRGGSC